MPHLLMLLPWLLLAAGATAMFFGFAVDPLWPAQDMPAALARRLNENAAVAASAYRAGIVLLAAGTAWLGLRWLLRRRRPRAAQPR